MTSSVVGLARSAAEEIRLAYEGYREEFQRVTRQARLRFEQREWKGGQRDAVERLELYRRAVEIVVGALEHVLGPSLHDPALWKSVKTFHAEELEGCPDLELAETFFNSVTRKVLTTLGVDAAIEYVDLDVRRDRYGDDSSVRERLELTSTLSELVRRALAARCFSVPYRDLEADAELAAAEIVRGWRADGQTTDIEALELIESIFYRGSAAYLVGRVHGGDAHLPLVVALLNGDEGIEVDAVLTTEGEVSRAFSYTHSHFLVDVSRPADVIRFLRSIMPRKPIAELFISLGYTKHGKTEMYRDLVGHFRRSLAPFDYAPGDAGLVMIVFTQRSYDYVFKVIRDEFAPPKTTTRQDVLNRYDLVFKHDRAGRLIEAQEFEHLIFDRRRFSTELLDELARSAAGTVTVTGMDVHIRHLYIERRVTPLNLYLRSADEQDAEHAVRDYGQAIRDLATTNIFPGDLLLKNFGVTRNGRVVFYDYDELCLVTDCVFRDLPTPRDPDEEMAAEPWFYVGEHDVFPEEFLQFLGLGPSHRRLLTEEHGEVLRPAFWRELQDRHRAGEVMDVFPYPRSKRLRQAVRGPDRASR